MKTTHFTVKLALSLCATAFLAAACTGGSDLSDADHDSLHAAIDGRSDKDKARDKFRNPHDTLNFCGVKSGDTVVELWPGGGWYTRVLHPYLAGGGGQLIAVHWPAGSEYEYRNRLRGEFIEEFGSVQGGKPIMLRDFEGGSEDFEFADGIQADHVLTFRNIHNWLADDSLDEVMAQSAAALKKGGSLCVIEHRAKPGTGVAVMKKSGYMTEEKVIEFAEAAGFDLADMSEINANPKDTADHEGGVWALPPSLRHGDKDREKYEEIGESDRMTLRFVKL